MKFLIQSLFFVLFLGLAFSSCEKNPCSGIVCKNGGTCINGFCDCPDGYEGLDCSDKLIPVSMTIDKIEVTEYPMMKPSSAPWDPTDGPDVVVLYKLPSGQIYPTNTMTNATGQTLVYSMDDPINALPYPCSDLNQSYNFRVLDTDTGNPDELMGSIDIVPMTRAVDLPAAFTLGNNTVTLKIHVTWNF